MFYCGFVDGSGPALTLGEVFAVFGGFTMAKKVNRFLLIGQVFSVIFGNLRC